MLLPIRCSTFSLRTSRPRLEISEVPPGGFLVLLTWSLFLCLFRGQSRERFSGKIYQYIISSCLYFKFNIRVIISVSLVFYIYISISYAMLEVSVTKVIPEDRVRLSHTCPFV